VVAPGVAPTRVAGVVSHVDIAPTLLEFAGLPALEDPSGMSLLPHLHRGAPLPERSVLSDIGFEVSAYDGEGYWTVRVRRPTVGPDPTPEERARALREQQLEWRRFERVDGASNAAEWRKTDESRLPAQILAYLSEEQRVIPAKEMSQTDVERLRALGYLAPDPPSGGPDR
jgi:hypothetical protein